MTFFYKWLPFQLGCGDGGKFPHFFPHSKSLKHASDHCSNAKWCCLTLPSTSIHLNLITAKIAYQGSESVQYFTKHWTLALKQWLPGSWHCRIWRRMLFWGSSLNILLPSCTDFHIFLKMDKFYFWYNASCAKVAYVSLLREHSAPAMFPVFLKHRNSDIISTVTLFHCS